MGTHILRVKSVDLDAWTDEQVELMLKWGNSKCNAYWELKLPEGYIPDGSKIENFIRTKYDMKKWAALLKPDPLAVLVLALALALALSPAPVPVQMQKLAPAVLSKQALRPVKPQPQLASELLLDDDFGTFSLALPSPAPKPQLPTKAASSQLLPRSQPPAVPQKSAPAPAPAAQAPPSNGRTDLKKSILSLYSLPSSSNSNVSSFSNSRGASQQNLNLGFNQQVPQQNTQPLSAGLAGLYASRTPASPPPSREPVGQLSDSLQGLNFAPSTLSLPQSKPSSQPAQQSAWENKWNDSSSSVNQWASDTVLPKTSVGATPGQFSLTLDDDLFKNVWS